MALSRPHDGRFVDVNEAFLKMTGYHRGEVIGQTPPVWRHAEDRHRVVHSLLTHGSLQTGEYEFVRKAGTPFQALAAAELVKVGGEHLVLSLALDISERKQAEDQLRRALADKETLMREVHHRVKNNLQMLCDMLFLQAEVEKPEGRAAVRDAYSRVFAIARLHEQLYQSLDAGGVHLGEYLGRLARGFNSFSPAIPVVLETGREAIVLQVDRAIHAGLIVNELVTNALKHAFPPGTTGEVGIRVRKLNGDVELEVRDTGKGLPGGVEIGHTQSLGLRIVEILSTRLGATVRVDTAHGTRFTLRFSIAPPA
jgi:PAS domain S-box-containing protein